MSSFFLRALQLNRRLSVLSTSSVRPALTFCPRSMLSSDTASNNESSTPRTRHGQCACGGVRYKMIGEPLITHACHCTDCQKLTGSAFVMNAWTERDNLEIQPGSILEQAKLSGGSGESHTVHFCPKCSSDIFSVYRAPKSVFVRVGTLDDPSSLEPDVHIFTRSKLPWIDLSNIKVPQYQGYYKMKDVWKPESLQRMRRLLPEKKGGDSNREKTLPNPTSNL